MDKSDRIVPIPQLRRIVKVIPYSTLFSRTNEKKLLEAIDELEWLRSYQSMGEVAPKEQYWSDNEDTDSD